MEGLFAESNAVIFLNEIFYHCLLRMTNKKADNSGLIAFGLSRVSCDPNR